MAYNVSGGMLNPAQSITGGRSGPAAT